LPWGGVQAITGTATLNARFPGQWFQTETGLHYNWHRHYDPTLGRYTQPDPLGFVDGPSVYGYAKLSPSMLIDFPGTGPAGPDGIIVIDPRTGGQIYPPPQTPPSEPGIEIPEPPKPLPPMPDQRKFCDLALARCLSNCAASKICQKSPMVAGTACSVGCATLYALCRFAKDFKGSSGG